MPKAETAAKPAKHTLVLTEAWEDYQGPTRTDVYQPGEHSVSQAVYDRAVAAGVVKAD